MRKTTALTSLTLAALVAAGLSTAVLAQEQPAPPPAGEDVPMFLFDKIDADKDGKVTQAEIDAFKAARFAEADADKDGKLSPAELVAMREKAEAERKMQGAEKMVARIDRDGDGLLSPEEMAAGPRPKSLIERMDTDGDGAVSKAEAEAAQARMQDRMEDHRGGKGDGHGKGDDHGKGDGHGKGDHHGGPDRDGEGGPRGGMWGWWFN